MSEHGGGGSGETMPGAAADGWRETNLAMWDERVPIHVGSGFYDLDGFRAGREELRGFEVAEVGDVGGRRLLHLQCHIGTDTLAWARRGARVTGLDFSQPAVDAASRLAAEIGLDHDRARFVRSDVYRAAEALPDERFDIVYTGLGALNWIPDLTAWAEVVAGLVAPGGFLYLAEFHPVPCVLADDARTVRRDYFDRAPEVWDEPGTYADLAAPTRHNRSVEWLHGLGDVVSAVTGAGLRLEFLHEHDFTLFPRFPDLVTGRDTSGDGSGGATVYRLPAGRPRVPMIYSLRASRS